MNLKYLHCSDSHLDSPFQGLQKPEPWLAERCRRAAHQAVQALAWRLVGRARQTFECERQPFVLQEAPVNSESAAWRAFGRRAF